MINGLVNIGFGNFINSNRVITILTPDSAPLKRIKEEARINKKLIDATHGRRTRAIIITDSNHVIVSAIQSETITNRFSNTAEVTTSSHEKKKWSGNMEKINKNNDCSRKDVKENYINMEKGRKGLLFVVSGPSGVGKGTLREKLFKSCQDLVYSISMTTRTPRKNEKNGVDYFFVSKDLFKQMIKEDRFVEWAIVHGDYKGTPRQFLIENLKKGIDTLLEIDVQGAVQVKSKMPEGIFIFIAPPSWKALEYRLRNRQTENKEALKRRLTDAKTEVKQIDFYDYIIINDNIETAQKQLESIIVAERCRINLNKI